MTMDVFNKVAGRYVFALPFLIFGVFHFMNASNMAGMIPGWLPGGVIWVYLTGLALIAASVSMMIKVMDQLASFLLGVMLLIFVLVLHLPGALEGDQASTTNLLKDLAMAGGAWLYAGYVAKPAA
jgi:putative oxidoreductase